MALSNSEYTKNPTLCPFCNGDTEEGPARDSGVIFTSHYCQNCGAEWEDVYELTGYAQITDES